MVRSVGKPCVMIIAGEASGDLHGANLVKAMAAMNPDLFFCGIGGHAMKAAGVRILLDAAVLSVVGITEVFVKLPDIVNGLTLARRLLKSLRPDLLILIDFPDFNLRVAKCAQKTGVPVLYYISPQFWAWRQGRVKKMRKLVDHVAVILPFEEAFFRDHHIPVTFVGHPLLDHPVTGISGGKGREYHGDGIPTVGFLPGSRDGEVARHLPVMLAAARLVRKQSAHVKFMVSVAPSLSRDTVAAMTAQIPDGQGYVRISGDVEKIFCDSDLVVAASGTVTLQAAISQTPVVIIYKVSPVSYWLGRSLIKVDNISLVNLIAGRKIVPELIQKEASAEKIATLVAEMVNDKKQLAVMRDNLGNVKDALGRPGASAKVAGIALDMLQNNIKVKTVSEK